MYVLTPFESHSMIGLCQRDTTARQFEHSYCAGRDHLWTVTNGQISNITGDGWNNIDIHQLDMLRHNNGTARLTAHISISIPSPQPHTLY